MLITILGVTLDGWAALNLGIQFILPLLVGLVTTKLTGQKQQALLLLTLTLVATIAAQALEAHDAGLPLNLSQIIAVAIVNYAVSLLTHYGIWKPTGLSSLLLAVVTKSSPAAIPPAPDPSAPVTPAAPVPALYVVNNTAPPASRMAG